MTRDSNLRYTCNVYDPEIKTEQNGHNEYIKLTLLKKILNNLLTITQYQNMNISNLFRYSRGNR